MACNIFETVGARNCDLTYFSSQVLQVATYSAQEKTVTLVIGSALELEIAFQMLH